MKVLVVGQGGREHALVWKLKQSPSVSEVYCAPGNAGTALDAINVDIADSDLNGLVNYATEGKFDLVVVGPEAPLVAGLSDKLAAANIPVFGPSKAAAALEGSKVYSKRLMQAARVPTAGFAIFDHAELAKQWVDQSDERGWVVKANGLAAGKGVIVCKDRNETHEAIDRILRFREFGDAGKQIVIEEVLVGQEASILAITDGRTIIPLEVAQDHKRAYDNDQGPNTGGMGAYCPAKVVTPDLMDEITKTILIPTIHALNSRETPFRGVLYAGVMLTELGPQTLEFNVRFGDPETQPVLMRLKSDLGKLLLYAAQGRLEELEPLEWDSREAVCVVMASEGYPGNYPKGVEISGIEAADKLPDVKVFHAGTKLVGSKVVTNGGRVLGVTALGDTIEAATARAYEAVDLISWNGGWCRRDIASKAV